MSENGRLDPALASPAAAQVHELVIRWIPATGQVQFGCSIPDQVAQLGMLEMAKAGIIQQGILKAIGKEPSVIVPARFAS